MRVDYELMIRVNRKKENGRRKENQEQVNFTLMLVQ